MLPSSSGRRSALFEQPAETASIRREYRREAEHGDLVVDTHEDAAATFLHRTDVFVSSTRPSVCRARD